MTYVASRACTRGHEDGSARTRGQWHDRRAPGDQGGRNGARARFTVQLEKSSWIALRVLPSGHTHPQFVHVGGHPVRASRRSAPWCREAIDVLWAQKSRFIRAKERTDTEAAFDFARRRYVQIAAECEEQS